MPAFRRVPGNPTQERYRQASEERLAREVFRRAEKCSVVNHQPRSTCSPKGERIWPQRFQPLQLRYPEEVFSSRHANRKKSSRRKIFPISTSSSRRPPKSSPQTRSFLILKSSSIRTSIFSAGW